MSRPKSEKIARRVNEDSGRVNAREPSFTAMWHAWLRNNHVTSHLSPILSDMLSVQLVPDQVLGRIVAVQNSFSPETAAAIVSMAVVRRRLLSDRLPQVHGRGVRQLLVLGAGLVFIQKFPSLE